MPSTDIDGTPILMLSSKEVALVHELVEASGYLGMASVKKLEKKLKRFLQETA